LSVAVLGKP